MHERSVERGGGREKGGGGSYCNDRAFKNDIGRGRDAQTGGVSGSAKGERLKKYYSCMSWGGATKVNIFGMLVHVSALVYKT